jgi:amidohydrolase
VNGRSTLDVDGLRADARRLLPDLVALRRAIHAQPEVGLHLPETQRRVLDALAGLDLEVHTGSALSSVVAVLRGGSPGPVVLLRADMDGLPLEEENDLDYRSTNGAMHSCGHDMHTAGLVGALRLLAARRDTLPGTIVGMFQPGEEILQGARLMLDEGLLDVAGRRPDAAFALHLGPGPAGVFGLTSNLAATGSTRIEISVRGPGGHGSRPHLSVDVVAVLAEILVGIQAVVTRQVDVQDPVVVTFTTLAAGQASNVIPSVATATGGIRNYSPAGLARVSAGIERLVTGIAEAHGATGTVSFEPGTVPMVNEPGVTAGAVRFLTGVFGPQRVLHVDVVAHGSEDFAYIAEQVPSTYMRLFATPPGLTGPSAHADNHTPHAQFDDSILDDHAVALAGLAIDYLTTHAAGHQADSSH